MKKLLQCNTKKKILRLDIVNLKKKTPKETVMLKSKKPNIVKNTCKK